MSSIEKMPSDDRMLSPAMLYIVLLAAQRIGASCEPERLRGSFEAPSFDAKEFHWSVGTRFGSVATAPC